MALEKAKSVYDDNSVKQDEVDNAIISLTEAKNKVILIETVNKNRLFNAINDASAFLKDISDTKDYYNAYELKTLMDSATKLYYNEDAIQTDVDKMTYDLEEMKASVKKKDASAQKAVLENIISKAETLNSSEYKQASWDDLQSVLTTVKTIEDGTISQYTKAANDLQNAIDNLSLKPQPTIPTGDPLVYVYKGGVETVVDSFKADESTAGVTKIKVTFDCAEDVNFGKYASIEFKATFGATENWSKYTGSDETSASGQTGCVIELPLAVQISDGDNIKLTAYTYA